MEQVKPVQIQQRVCGYETTKKSKLLLKFKRTQFLTQGFKKYGIKVKTKNPNVPWKLRKQKYG